MAAAAEFNIRALIREVCAEASDLNLQKLAAEVDARIRPENRDEALRQCLPMMVHEVAHKVRRDTRVMSRSEVGSEGGAGSQLPAETGASPTREMTTDADELARKRAARSPKVAGIREYWRQALLTAHSVNRSGDLKRLGEMNRADLVFNIEAREDVARRNAAKALEFRSLLDLVTRHDVECVGHLPEDVLSVTLVRSA